MINVYSSLYEYFLPAIYRTLVFLFPAGGVQDLGVHPGQPQDQPVAVDGGEGDAVQPGHPAGPGRGGHHAVQLRVHPARSES